MKQKLFNKRNYSLFPARNDFRRKCFTNFRENGEITGIILLLHDITQIRHLENVRSEFVTNVSHELKTPVTALKGFAETLLDGAMYDEMLLKNS